MVVYSFYIFDRHSTFLYKPQWPSSIHSEKVRFKKKSRLTSNPAECIYTKTWLPPSQLAPPISDPSGRPATANPTNGQPPTAVSAKATTRAQNDAKLIFGTVFSLRNMVRKLGGEDDAFISYRTGQYRLHYYETPTNLRFVLLTDTGTMSMRNVLHQIYINLWVEYGMSMTSSSIIYFARGGGGFPEKLR